MKKWLECLIFITLVTGGTARASTPKHAGCELFLTNLKSDDLEFSGLTPEGLKKVRVAQQGLKLITERFNARFESMQSILDTALVTIVSGHNMMLLGQPGAAKSGAIRWLIKKLWVKQMHEMMTESVLFGGQTAEGIAKGREELNTEGAMVDAEFALLDEVNNANPQVLAALLSLMNPEERDYSVGGVLRRSKLRAIFTTGNATRYEILQSFLERGLQSGTAFLNRSAFKVFAVNWLHRDAQERRDAYKKRQDQLLSVARFGAKDASTIAEEKLSQTETVNIDWDVVAQFAQQAFITSDELEVMARDFANKMHDEINEKIKKSEAAHIEDAKNHPAILTPAAEWTERFRGELLRVIKISAALDYLRLAGPGALDPKLLKEPIVLKPLSIWRAYLLATTVASGLTRLDPRELKVEFNLLRKKDGSLFAMGRAEIKKSTKDKRAEQELDDLFNEQDWFNDTIGGLLKSSSKTAKEISHLLNLDPTKAQMESSEFELMIYFMQKKAN